jgi:hypothetical protein
LIPALSIFSSFFASNILRQRSPPLLTRPLSTHLHHSRPVPRFLDHDPLEEHSFAIDDRHSVNGKGGDSYRRGCSRRRLGSKCCDRGGAVGDPKLYDGLDEDGVEAPGKPPEDELAYSRERHGWLW